MQPLIPSQNRLTLQSDNDPLWTDEMATQIHKERRNLINEPTINVVHSSTRPVNLALFPSRRLNAWQWQATFPCVVVSLVSSTRPSDLHRWIEWRTGKQQWSVKEKYSWISLQSWKFHRKICWISFALESCNFSWNKFFFRNLSDADKTCFFALIGRENFCRRRHHWRGKKAFFRYWITAYRFWNVVYEDFQNRNGWDIWSLLKSPPDEHRRKLKKSLRKWGHANPHNKIKRDSCLWPSIHMMTSHHLNEMKQRPIKLHGCTFLWKTVWEIASGSNASS